MTMQETIQMIAAMLCAVAVIVSPVACTIHRNEKMAEAVKNGADPIEYACAAETFSSAGCNNYMMRKNAAASK
jgi:hypothetical protein